MRKLWMLVGMSMMVLGRGPDAGAGSGSVTVTACLACHGGAQRGHRRHRSSRSWTDSMRLPGEAAARGQVGKRQSDIMAPLIAALKKQQIAGMAAHFASQTPARGAVQNPELAARGKVLYKRATAPAVCRGVSAVTHPMAQARNAIPAWRVSCRPTPCSNWWTSRAASAATIGRASCATSPGD